MDFRRIGPALLMTGAALLAPATPAFAHTSLKSSSPGEGAVLAAVPAEVVLTFSGPVSVETVSVAGWELGAPGVSDAVVTVPVRTVGNAGDYVLSYRVESDDGHAITGNVKFKLAVSPPVTSSSPVTPPVSASAVLGQVPVSVAAPERQADAVESGGLPGWVWVLLTVAAVGVGVVVRRVVRGSRVGGS
jgi:methionine-rich copper-binding protein CopC